MGNDEMTEIKADNRKKEFIRTLKFIGFSISAGVIEAGTFALLTEFTGMQYWPR